ncbi:zf-CCHC domain-containing protein [Tanacetum coccineum]
MIMVKGLFYPSGGKYGGKGGRGGSMAGSGGDGVVGGEVNGRGVVLGVWKSLLGEIHGEVMEERGGETIVEKQWGLDGWIRLVIVGNSQVKDNKIDLLVQQYEQITILEEESIDSGFARFNTIITNLKALDEAKVTAIEESKDLSSLALDELTGNLKVHEVVMEKDSEIYKGKKESVKSIALKAKKESSDDETLTSGSDDEEYVMAQRDDKKGKNDRQCFRYGDLNHLIGDCPKPPRNQYQKAFVGGCRSNSENEVEDTINDETCLMAQSSNEVTLDFSHYSDNASSFDKDKLRLTISPNVKVFFDLPNVDVLDGGYLDLTLSSPMLKI